MREHPGIGRSEGIDMTESTKTAVHRAGTLAAGFVITLGWAAGALPIWLAAALLVAALALGVVIKDACR